MTTAERVQRHRRARAERLAVLERESVSLTLRLAESEAALADAHEEIARLSASQCQHPTVVVHDGRCHACGSWV